VLSSFYRGELPELRRVSIGADLVFGRLWQETGCRDVLHSLLGERQFGFDVERVSMPVEISPEVPVENSPLRCVVGLC
jgi:hypothetical protein